MEDNCTSGKENITLHYFFHMQSLIISSPLTSFYHFSCQHIVEITYLFSTKVLLYHVPLIETLGAYVPGYRMKSSILPPTSVENLSPRPASSLPKWYSRVEASILIAKATFSKGWKASYERHNQFFTIFLLRRRLHLHYLLSLLIISEQIYRGKKEWEKEREKRERKTHLSMTDI